MQRAGGVETRVIEVNRTPGQPARFTTVSEFRADSFEAALAETRRMQQALDANHLTNKVLPATQEAAGGGLVFNTLYSRLSLNYPPRRPADVQHLQTRVAEAMAPPVLSRRSELRQGEETAAEKQQQQRRRHHHHHSRRKHSNIIHNHIKLYNGRRDETICPPECVETTSITTTPLPLLPTGFGRLPPVDMRKLDSSDDVPRQMSVASTQMPSPAAAAAAHHADYQPPTSWHSKSHSVVPLTLTYPPPVARVHPEPNTPAAPRSPPPLLDVSAPIRRYCSYEPQLPAPLPPPPPQSTTPLLIKPRCSQTNGSSVFSSGISTIQGPMSVTHSLPVSAPISYSSPPSSTPIPKESSTLRPAVRQIFTPGPILTTKGPICPPSTTAVSSCSGTATISRPAPRSALTSNYFAQGGTSSSTLPLPVAPKPNPLQHSKNVKHVVRSPVKPLTAAWASGAVPIKETAVSAMSSPLSTKTVQFSSPTLARVNGSPLAAQSQYQRGPLPPASSSTVYLPPQVYMSRSTPTKFDSAPVLSPPAAAHTAMRWPMAPTPIRSSKDPSPGGGVRIIQTIVDGGVPFTQHSIVASDRPPLLGGRIELKQPTIINLEGVDAALERRRRLLEEPQMAARPFAPPGATGFQTFVEHSRKYSRRANC